MASRPRTVRNPSLRTVSSTFPPGQSPPASRSLSYGDASGGVGGYQTPAADYSGQSPGYGAAHEADSSYAQRSAYGGDYDGGADRWQQGYQPVVEIEPEGTIWWGLGLTLASVGLLTLGLGLDLKGAAILGFIIFLVTTTFAQLAVLVMAFREDTVTGLLTFFVPFYVYYYAGFRLASRTIKWMFWSPLLGMALSAVLLIGVIRFANQGDCARIRPHFEQFSEVMTNFESQLGASRDAAQMSNVVSNISSQIRIMNGSLGEVAFDDPDLEMVAVEYFKLALKAPDVLDVAARAMVNSPSNVAQAKWREAIAFMDRLDKAEQRLANNCGQFSF